MNATGWRRCTACYTGIAPGAVAVGGTCGGETEWLCADCWAKVERIGRAPQQVIEAVLLRHSPEFGGPDCVCDHDDYRALERLGLWP